MAEVFDLYLLDLLQTNQQCNTDKLLTAKQKNVEQNKAIRS